MVVVKEYRATRLDKTLRTVPNTEVEFQERIGYYCYAETMKQAEEIFAQQFPDEKLEIRETKKEIKGKP